MPRIGKAPTNKTGEPRRAGLFLAAVLLSLASALAGCRSTSEADNRPAWVRQAEAQLREDPEWKVRGEGAQVAERGSSGGAGTGGVEHRRSPDEKDSSKPPPSPPGARWGETKVFVEVEE
ncbi:MAG: hypothetical protein ACLFTU_06000 [Puniceicoccaceae bacterium]